MKKGMMTFQVLTSVICFFIIKVLNVGLGNEVNMKIK